MIKHEKASITGNNFRFLSRICGLDIHTIKNNKLNLQAIHPCRMSNNLRAKFQLTRHTLKVGTGFVFIAMEPGTEGVCGTIRSSPEALACPFLFPFTHKFCGGTTNRIRVKEEVKTCQMIRLHHLQSPNSLLMMRDFLHLLFINLYSGGPSHGETPQNVPNLLLYNVYYD